MDTTTRHTAKSQLIIEFTQFKHKVGSTVRVEPAELMDPEHRDETIAFFEEPVKAFLLDRDQRKQETYSIETNSLAGHYITIAFRHNEGSDTFTIVEV